MEENTIKLLKREIHELKAEIEETSDIVQGNDRKDITGLRKRVSRLETLVEALDDDNSARKNQMKGLQYGLGLTGLGAFGNIILQIILNQ